MTRDPPPRSLYKEFINTKITSYFENELRLKAATNSAMKYFDVNAIGLRNRIPISMYDLNDTKAAFTLSGKSELYRHKPASNIFDAVRYRRFVAIKLTFAAKCKRGLTVTSM